MREILSRGKRVDNGEWVEGYSVELPKANTKVDIALNASEPICEDTAMYIISVYAKQYPPLPPSEPLCVFDYDKYEVDTNTISQYIGLTDKNGKKIFENYLVKLFGRVGVVCKCQGAYGIGFEKAISFAKLDNYTYSHNQTIPHYLYCDNFISFWELMWNFNCEDNMCDVVEVIGNKWDNLELLRGDEQ